MIVADEESAPGFKQGRNDASPLHDVGQPAKNPNGRIDQVKVTTYRLPRVIDIGVHVLDVHPGLICDGARVSQRSLGQVQAHNSRGSATGKSNRVRPNVALQMHDLLAGKAAKAPNVEGKLRADGVGVREQATQTAIVAGHVQVRAVIPVFLIV